MSTQRAAGTRQGSILAELREEIVSGKLRPGEPLPKRKELASRFGTSNGTIQEAVDTLAEEGFVQAIRGKGTYVREDLPHLSRYGLVCPQTPKPNGHFSQFWRALAEAAGQIEESGKCSLPIQDAEKYRPGGAEKLKSALQKHTLGGLIFADCPVLESHFEGHDIPRVSIASAPRSADVPAVYVDVPRFMERAVQDLQEEGCRRVAVLSSHPGVDDVKHFEHLASRAGMQVPPYWKFAVNPTDGEALSTYVHLLMSHPDHRPDGIVISDDNLVGNATAGLQAAGIRVPRDVKVVAETNFPAVPVSRVPVKRLGFDIVALLRVCVEKIQAMQRGEAPEPMSYVEPVFEEELNGEVTK